MSGPEILHATLVARRVQGHWRGALIRGASGAGKSTLALRAAEAGFALVADDRVVTWASGGRAYGKAPPVLAGLIEVRGVGVIGAAPGPAMVPIGLVVDLVSTTPERMPEPATTLLAGVPVPQRQLATGDPDALLRLAAALAAPQHGL